MGTIIIGIIVFGALAVASYRIIRNRKQNKCSGCPGCGGCSGSCHQ